MKQLLKPDYLTYLLYVLKHKFYVFQIGRELGVSFWQLVRHDFSKFKPDEFIPYAKWFYGFSGRPWTSTQEGYGLENDDIREALDLEREQRFNAFKDALLLHFSRNPHHWNHWLHREEDDTLTAREMPYEYVLEMCADWLASSKGINGDLNKFLDWYTGSRNSMNLHPNTEKHVTRIIKNYSDKKGYKLY